MKRLVLLLLLTTIFTSCTNLQTREKTETYHLYKDFVYSHSINYVRPRESAFQFQFDSPGSKKYPSIVQDQPGSISFYCHLQNQPTLSFSLQFLERKKSDLGTKILVESDDPVLKREYAAPLKKNQKIDLKEFQGRIVRITFSAKSKNLIGLGGLLFWIDPTVQQTKPEQTRLNTQFMEAFRERHRRHNVVLFLLDATNPAHLGCYGYPKPTSPVIDSIAAEGVLWENAISQGVSTLPSTASLFTGLYPNVHGLLEKRSVLPESFFTMAEAFHANGFRTAMFTANPNASPLTGTGQGFEMIWQIQEGRTISADEFVEPFSDWVTQMRHQQFFAYLHIREPHWPYTPPPDFLDRFYDGPPFQVGRIAPFVVPPAEEQRQIIAAYDANLAFADTQVGKMIAHLRSLGLHNNTIIVILSDHGEAFWKHGKQGHNFQVYEDTVRIPLIVRFPHEIQWKGRREPYVVGSIDLLPTFADIFSFSRKNRLLNGQSLLPFLFGKAESAFRFRTTQVAEGAVYGVRSEKFKYIYHAGNRKPHEEFFHLVSDPNERQNVISDYPISSGYYRVQLQKTLLDLEHMRTTRGFAPEREAAIDEETEQELRALGYIN